MMKNNHPIINDLYSRLDSCKTQLLSLLDDWHKLQNVIQPRLFFTYDTLFGDLEFEIKQKSEQAEKIHRRIDLLSNKLKNGQKLNENTINYVNMIVENEQTRTRNNKSKSYDNERIENKDNDSQSDMYRSLAKKLHPDINGENEHFSKFWHNIQDAYKKGNVHRLRLFHQTLCKESIATYNDENPKNEENKLRREIRKLESNIYEEKLKLTKMKSSEPFNLEDKFNDNIWVNNRKNKLKEKLDLLESKIKNNEKFLLNMSKIYGYDEKKLLDDILTN